MLSRRNCGHILLLCLAVLFPCKIIAGENKFICPSQKKVSFADKILEGICYVPNEKNGYDPVQMHDGEFKAGGKWMEIKDIALGKLENKPVAIVLLADWKGGNILKFSLLLYVESGDKAVTTGYYTLGEHCSTENLRVKDNKVTASIEQSLPGKNQSIQKTLSLSLRDFKRIQKAAGGRKR